MNIAIEELLQKLAISVIDGKHLEAVELTKQLLALNHTPKEILDNGLLAGMNVVGQRFRDNIIFVPQVLISARAMKFSLAILEPLLADSNIPAIGTVIMGTVKGDIHDIGKNIVSMMLRGNGFKVVDIGIDASHEKFIDAVKKENAQIVGMSALLTTTMLYMKAVIEKLKGEKLPVKIMIGGAPVSKAFADQIGADAYGKNASEAVRLAREFVDQENNN
ncbi:MAG: methyltransferase [Ignavibacteria bacterium RIFOXYB2_FULL_35_12]|nr:MAG: methyltransferase [Ignavibacteria bacterium GWA2_36_19]OGU50442.1 MAG: methyltransferase [Ignavibacteria bacterium GWC2_35_8]OGU58789.1 MAG: methyltransferase [Ignavibacteria bacterium GWF2_35_20]OGU78148.1 MAG: methyltransferase [Ignavibacteria bacterium RIFOXYA2_FULL_35_9]OGU91337.1 MAG: methyltransferase [Ignavibacteria bacterium RIFOXYA12_FULL_35_25]OGU94416.1 MAG: methyltransferase [Ignavibacteria bacterium RIFOXYB12_FULL_35_14]OGU98389.1 MAG: methyltransferase [Ignavibacteria ba